MVISKLCDSDCPGTEFIITVTGNNNPQPPRFNLGDGDSQTVTLGPGSFMISELNGLAPTFTGNCVQRGPDDASGTISAGQTLHCTMTNHI